MPSWLSVVDKEMPGLLISHAFTLTSSTYLLNMYSVWRQLCVGEEKGKEESDSRGTSEALAPALAIQRPSVGL